MAVDGRRSVSGSKAPAKAAAASDRRRPAPPALKGVSRQFPPISGPQRCHLIGENEKVTRNRRDLAREFKKLPKARPTSVTPGLWIHWNQVMRQIAGLRKSEKKHLASLERELSSREDLLNMDPTEDTKSDALFARRLLADFQACRSEHRFPGDDVLAKGEEKPSGSVQVTKKEEEEEEEEKKKKNEQQQHQVQQTKQQPISKDTSFNSGQAKKGVAAQVPKSMEKSSKGLMKEEQKGTEKAEKDENEAKGEEKRQEEEEEEEEGEGEEEDEEEEEKQQEQEEEETEEGKKEAEAHVVDHNHDNDSDYEEEEEEEEEEQEEAEAEEEAQPGEVEEEQPPKEREKGTPQEKDKENPQEKPTTKPKAQSPTGKRKRVDQTDHPANSLPENRPIPSIEEEEEDDGHPGRTTSSAGSQTAAAPPQDIYATPHFPRDDFGKAGFDYYSHDRAWEIYDDPLGFEDCVVPEWRPAKRRSRWKTRKISGALYVPSSPL